MVQPVKKFIYLKYTCTYYFFAEALPLNSSCQIHEQCTHSPHALCVKGKCTCIEGYSSYGKRCMQGYTGAICLPFSKKARTERTYLTLKCITWISYTIVRYCFLVLVSVRRLKACWYCTFFIKRSKKRN